MRKCLVILCIIFQLITNAQIPKLWGTTAVGGTGGCGRLFVINGDGTGYLVPTQNLGGGCTPGGKLIYNSDGKLYGQCFQQGQGHSGTFYRFSPLNNTCTTICNLDSNSTSGWICSNLLRQNDSIFFGVMYQDIDAAHGGRLLKYNKNSNVYSKAYYFADSTKGRVPRDIMITSTNMIYGTTDHGGSNHHGVLFSFDPSANVYTNLHDFDTTDYKATGVMTEGANGKLYGLTMGGGTHNCGYIFSFDPVSTTYSNEHSFDTLLGIPVWLNGMIKGTNNLLYGMTGSGGNSNYGVIFSFDPSTSVYIKLYDFTWSTGCQPLHSLMQASDGNLYGTAGGGAYNDGAVFKFDLSSNTYTLLHSFDNTNTYEGYLPMGGLTETPGDVGFNDLANDAYVNLYPNPSSGVFSITSSEKIIRIDVMNVIGEKIYSENINAEKAEINLSKKTKGIYFVKINSNKGIITKKLIVE